LSLFRSPAIWDMLLHFLAAAETGFGYLKVKSFIKANFLFLTAKTYAIKDVQKKTSEIITKFIISTTGLY